MSKQTVRYIICAISIMSGFGALPAIGWLIFGAISDANEAKAGVK